MEVNNIFTPRVSTQMATIAPSFPSQEEIAQNEEQNAEAASNTAQHHFFAAAPKVCILPGEYPGPYPGPEGALTWRINYNDGVFKFLESRPGDSEGLERVVSEGGWGYPGYFKMLALKDANGEFTLPPNCTELTIILEYKFADSKQATGSMKLMSEYEIPEVRTTGEDDERGRRARPPIRTYSHPFRDSLRSCKKSVAFTSSCGTGKP